MKRSNLLFIAIFSYIFVGVLAAGEMPQTVTDSHTIVLPNYTAVELSVPEALKLLSDLSIKADPKKKGVAVVLDPNVDSSILKNINLTLKNATASKIIRFISLFAGLRPEYGEKAVRLIPIKYNPDISAWKVLAGSNIENKEEYEKFLSKATHSDYEWVVSKNAGEVIAQLQKDVSSRQAEEPEFDMTVEIRGTPVPSFKSLKVRDGWLIAYNRGEWGGAVYWFSPDGKEKKELSKHQINQFLVEGDRIFAVQGLAHLSLSKGSMIEFKKERNEWTASEFVSLPGSAEAITKIAQDEFAIVTTDSLLAVNLEKRILEIIPKGNWGILYPNSIETDEDYIYIGMRQFVVRWKRGQSSQKFDFLVPGSSWLNLETD